MSPKLSVSLDCPFLIALSGVSNVYLLHLGKHLIRDAYDMSSNTNIENVITEQRAPHCGIGTDYLFGAPQYAPVFSGVHVARSLDLCVLDCRSLFFLLSFSFWTLYCLSFFGVAFNND